MVGWLGASWSKCPPGNLSSSLPSPVVVDGDTLTSDASPFSSVEGTVPTSLLLSLLNGSWSSLLLLGFHQYISHSDVGHSILLHNRLSCVGSLHALCSLVVLQGFFGSSVRITNPDFDLAVFFQA